MPEPAGSLSTKPLLFGWFLLRGRGVVRLSSACVHPSTKERDAKCPERSPALPPCARMEGRVRRHPTVGSSACADQASRVCCASRQLMLAVPTGALMEAPVSARTLVIIASARQVTSVATVRSPRMASVRTLSWLSSPCSPPPTMCQWYSPPTTEMPCSFTTSGLKAGSIRFPGPRDCRIAAHLVLRGSRTAITRISANVPVLGWQMAQGYCHQERKGEALFKDVRHYRDLVLQYMIFSKTMLFS
ncbi:hypothetical protein CEXT_339211 [Caerostris extrusa]|uniref:Uncharacterized protein n=1 Tax=Caerostris extrusa TaxID=172846 RepID=A0AAV4TQ66_CAEEX|nr:hypothetical protein CEXT_339211 [Caerostris extrusa]